LAANIYVLINQAMPGLIKIGRTTDNIESRMRQLDASGVPLPFECFYAVEVSDPGKVEHALHEAFEVQRVRRNREFFQLSPDEPTVNIELMAIREVTLRTDIVSESGNQEARDQARRRRSLISFSSVGIRVGAELDSAFDEKVTCAVDTSVTFRGHQANSSNVAHTAAMVRFINIANLRAAIALS
jgi:hypothetical protein